MSDVADIEKCVGIKLGVQLGAGSSGRVFATENGKEAIKIQVVPLTRRRRDSVDRQIRDIENEISMLEKLEHQNIIKLQKKLRHESLETMIYGLILPRCVMSLDMLIRKRGALGERCAVNYLCQLIKALSYVHAHGIVHCDLKPGNVLLDSDNGILLSDFGSAVKLVEVSRKSRGYVATRWYRPPELLLSRNAISYAIDLWALGCIAVESLNGKPFLCGTSQTDQFARILDALGDPPVEFTSLFGQRAFGTVSIHSKKKTPLRHLLPFGTSFQLVDLISRWLKYLPAERLSATDSLETDLMVRFCRSSGDKAMAFPLDEYSGVESQNSLWDQWQVEIESSPVLSPPTLDLDKE